MTLEPWQISLLNSSGVEEFSFSYNGVQKIFLDGKKLDGEWIIRMRVHCPNYFAWGVSRHRTKFTGVSSEVIRYYLAVVMNQMSEYGVTKGRADILRIIK